MRVGLVGHVEFKEIPIDLMDWLLMAAAGLLVGASLFVLY